MGTLYHVDSSTGDIVTAGSITATGSITSNTGDLTLKDGHAVVFEDTELVPKAVTIEAPTTLTNSYTLKLPVDQSSGTKVLQNDGSGNLSWATGGGGSGTVNSGTAGRLSLYATSTDAVSDTYIQNTKNITLDIATQGSRSQNLAITIPNPGNAVTTANVILDTDTNSYTLSGTYTLPNALAITATTNQLVLSGPTRTATITAPEPATSSRTYTFPDLSGDYSVVGTIGTQTIGGSKTFSSVVSITTAAVNSSISFTDGTASVGIGIYHTSEEFVIGNTGLNSAQPLRWNPSSGTMRLGDNTNSLTLVSSDNEAFGLGIQPATNLTLERDTSLLVFFDHGPTNTVSITAPSSVTSSYTLKLPVAQSSGTQHLVNDGSGNLSWATGVTSLNSLTGALSIVGTTDEITVTPSGSNITLSTPQAIGTLSGPQFKQLSIVGDALGNGIDIRGATAGIVIRQTSSPYIEFLPTSATYGFFIEATSTALSGNRTYKLSDVGADGNFVIDQGTQLISGAKTFSSDVTISGNNGLIINDSEGTPKSVTIKTPVTLTSTYTLVLPITQGGANQVLQNDGSGNLSWKVGPNETASFTASVSSPVTPNATVSSTIIMTVDAALTINGPTGGVDGQKITYRLVQDSSGHAVTFSTGAGNFEFGTDIPSFTASGANLIDYVGTIYNVARSRWDIVSVIQGF